VRWSHQPDGRVRALRDGVAILSHAGPNTYNDWLAPYLKIGLYIPAWGNTAIEPAIAGRTVLFDAIVVNRTNRLERPVGSVAGPDSM
jgi:hypothetical protein